MKKREVNRILCIVSSMDTGGAETFLMKIYRAINREEIQMDFYCMSDKKGYYDDEIKKMGGRIYNGLPKSKKPIKSFINIKSVVEKENYKYVMRVSQHSLAALDLVAAKLGGAKNLIMRSSNANSQGGVGKILHRVFNWLPKSIPTLKIAPSELAAEYTFGKNSLKKGEVKLVKNAIPIENFTFDNKIRRKIRTNLGINDKFVVGHIGRFNIQKNHTFLLEVFKEIMSRKPNSVLLLIGKGELQSDIKSQINNLNLNNNVIFLGIRDDIPELLMAMDVLVFPSYYEGMPNTIIEAQATSLPCIVSDTITKEADILGIIKYLSLDLSAKVWAENAILSSREMIEVNNINQSFVSSGYDIKVEADKLMKLILGKNL